MCLHYVDDEDSWINLNFDDLRGFTELWQYMHEWFLKEGSRELNYMYAPDNTVVLMLIW